MDPTQSTSTYLFTQGVLGVLVFVLGAVCWKFYNRIQELQDARLADSKEARKEGTDIIQANTAALNLFGAKIEGGKR